MGDMRIKAKVVGNTFVVAEKLDFPEGAEVVIDVTGTEGGFELDAEAEAELARAMEQVRLRRGLDADTVFERLRAGAPLV